jgi:hypothetical protein
MVYSTSDIYIIRIIENRVMDMKGAAAPFIGRKTASIIAQLPLVASHTKSDWGYPGIPNSIFFLCVFTCLHMVKQHISASWIGETHPIRTSI